MATFLRRERFVAWDSFAKRGLNIVRGDNPSSPFCTYADYLADFDCAWRLKFRHRSLAEIIIGPDRQNSRMVITPVDRLSATLAGPTAFTTRKEDVFLLPVLEDFAPEQVKQVSYIVEYHDGGTKICLERGVSRSDAEKLAGLMSAARGYKRV